MIPYDDDEYGCPHNGLSELDLNRIQISTRKVFNVRFSLRISDILLLHQE